MTVEVSPLTFIATSDLSAVTKGRALLSKDLKEGSTVGWVPANLGIGASGHIVDQIPFGSTGDLRLLPDFDSAHDIAGVPGRPDIRVIMADIVRPDGSPSANCLRSFLKQTLASLKEEFGVEIVASFEHEFMDLDPTGDHHPFSWHNFQRTEPIGSALVTAMERSGLEPENWLAEYGDHQYEVTVRHTGAVEAADRAVLTRDLARDMFAAHGHRTTFAPVLVPGGTGNGVHVHFGFTREDGSNPFYDPDAPGMMSEFGGRFSAGILAHSRALAAIFAPLTVSYLRLRPNQWASAGIFLGKHNREALLRLCPVIQIGGKNPEPQVHLEFRGADIGANPYLLLGAILRAGLEGLRRGDEPAQLHIGEVDHEGLPSLPRDLDEALDALEADETAMGWFEPDLMTTYLRVKRVEARTMEGVSPMEQCERYSRVY